MVRAGLLGHTVSEFGLRVEGLGFLGSQIRSLRPPPPPAHRCFPLER